MHMHTQLSKPWCTKGLTSIDITPFASHLAQPPSIETPNLDLEGQDTKKLGLQDDTKLMSRNINEVYQSISNSI